MNINRLKSRYATALEKAISLDINLAKSALVNNINDAFKTNNIESLENNISLFEDSLKITNLKAITA